MKQAGIIILLAGLVSTILAGYSLIAKERVIDAHALQITLAKNNALAWLAMGGALAVLTGAVIFLKAKQKITKKFRHGLSSSCNRLICS